MGARFIFRLQPVLEQRERAEQEAQRRLAEVQRQRVALEDVLRRCQLAIRTAKDDLRDRLLPVSNVPERASISDIRLQASASLHQNALAQRAAIELSGVMQRQERSRQELATAAAARKAVELLRERQLAEWKREQNKREIAELDDLANSRRIRERAGNVDDGGFAVMRMEVG